MDGPVLVTGAEGFAGRHLLAELGDAALPVEVDVLEAEELGDAVRAARPVAVVHLAAISSVAESWASPADAWQVNAVGTVNLLEALVSVRPAPRLLFASTGEVYGQAEQVPTTEESPRAPISPYAASKAAAEIACEQVGRAPGLDVVIARAFQHEGPGRDERFAIGSWTQQVAELELDGGGTLRVGDLSAERDITDVRDVCRAYRLLLDPAVAPGIYNVASGTTVRMTEVLDLLVGLAKAPISVEHDSARLRPSELPVVWGDPSKLAAATGWKPEIPLRQTIADALDYAREMVAQKRVAQT